MTQNPFTPAAELSGERGVFGNARLRRSGFLYRVIQIDDPVPCELVYSGWWFVQRIWIDGVLAWWEISWLTIQRQVEFQLPATGGNSSSGRIEINFGRGLQIRRFRVWIDGQPAYDEIH